MCPCNDAHAVVASLWLGAGAARELGVGERGRGPRRPTGQGGRRKESMDPSRPGRWQREQGGGVMFECEIQRLRCVVRITKQLEVVKPKSFGTVG